jgi:hypothetical protein
MAKETAKEMVTATAMAMAMAMARVWVPRQPKRRLVHC